MGLNRLSWEVGLIRIFRFLESLPVIFSGEEFRKLPIESDSVADEPVSSTLRLALSAISEIGIRNILDSN